MILGNLGKGWVDKDSLKGMVKVFRFGCQKKIHSFFFGVKPVVNIQYKICLQ